jgi:hypothetical protein
MSSYASFYAGKFGIDSGYAKDLLRCTYSSSHTETASVDAISGTGTCTATGLTVSIGAWDHDNKMIVGGTSIYTVSSAVGQFISDKSTGNENSGTITIMDGHVDRQDSVNESDAPQSACNKYACNKKHEVEEYEEVDFATDDESTESEFENYISQSRRYSTSSEASIGDLGVSQQSFERVSIVPAALRRGSVSSTLAGRQLPNVIEDDLFCISTYAEYYGIQHAANALWDRYTSMDAGENHGNKALSLYPSTIWGSSVDQKEAW